MDNIAHDLYHVPVLTMEGKNSDLEAYRNKVLLIVNVASRCGFTPQYTELEALHREYYDRGFRVLGFPCDQFMHQEPGSNQDIQAFAERCFKVSFPLFAKIKVKGTEQAALYTYLEKNIEKKSMMLIPWNFTKILVDAKGRVLCRYSPLTSFKTLRKAIEAVL